MYRELIARLIEESKIASSNGAMPDEIRSRLLDEAIRLSSREFDSRSFIEWVKDDRQYCYYYYDVQQSGACAKPLEVASMILEAIVMDALE